MRDKSAGLHLHHRGRVRVMMPASWAEPSGTLRCFMMPPPPVAGVLKLKQIQGGLVWEPHQLLLAGGFLQEVFIRLTKRVQQTFSDQVVHILSFS